MQTSAYAQCKGLTARFDPGYLVAQDFIYLLCAFGVYEMPKEKLGCVSFCCCRNLGFIM